MTTPAADYEAAVRALRAQTLPAIVEYTQQGDAHGIMGWNGAPERVVVDVRAGKIISVTPSRKDKEGVDDDSPVIKHMLDPACYHATGERAARWNGIDAVAISVENSCSNDDLDISTIYADATSLELLGADGSETDEGMIVDFSVHYGKFGGYILPSSISAHAHGSGGLFWARERAEIRYSDYAFTDTRRQSH